MNEPFDFDAMTLPYRPLDVEACTIVPATEDEIRELSEEDELQAIRDAEGCDDEPVDLRALFAFMAGIPHEQFDEDGDEEEPF
jgi:hypothetical protein